MDDINLSEKFIVANFLCYFYFIMINHILTLFQVVLYMEGLISERGP